MMLPIKTNTITACAAAATGIMLALLPARPAAASFWQGCEITGTVTTVGDVMGHPELGLNVTGVETMGGSHAPCDDKVGKDMLAIVTKVPEGVSFKRGMSITLDYNYYNAMSPNGVIDDIRWEFISVND